MSTRSEVTIIGEFQKLKLYHHHDGYPEGVGYDLMNRFFDKIENANVDFDFVCNELVKDANDEYEITQYNHTDREYEYEVDTVKHTIRCWSVDWYDDEDGHWCAKRGQEIDLLKMWNNREVANG